MSDLPALTRSDTSVCGATSNPCEFLRYQAFRLQSYGVIDFIRPIMRPVNRANPCSRKRIAALSSALSET